MKGFGVFYTEVSINSEEMTMSKYQLEFKFRDDHVVRQGCARVIHNDPKEAETMLLKAMSLTVADGTEPRFLEVGPEHADEHFPKHHVRIMIGIGGGDTRTHQLPKSQLLAENTPSP